MKRIKLSLKTSSNNNYKYYIYRSERAEDLPANVNVLKLLNPIIAIDEALATHEAIPMTEDILPDRTKIPTLTQTPYALTYRPLLSPIHVIILTVTSLKDGVEYIEKYLIEFDGFKNIKKITYDNGDVNQVKQMDILSMSIKDNTIFIKNDYIVAAQKIEAFYYMEVINAFDDDTKELNGIEYKGPVATGMITPTVEVSDHEQPLTTATSIPYMVFHPYLDKDGVLYYYRIVATDPVGNVSDPSGIFNMYLNQDLNQIKFKLQYSDDYDELLPENATWITVGKDILNGDTIAMGQYNTQEYLDYGPIFDKIVPAIKNTDVVGDLTYVLSDGTYSASVPNVWQQDNPLYNTRKIKAFRFVAVDTENKQSRYSDVVNDGPKKLSIEQMIVFKKDVTTVVDAQKKLPVTEEDAAAIKVKTWIKKDGIYYDASSHASLPVDVEKSDDPISIMTEVSVTDNITFIDRHVENGKLYNYTIYTYDACGMRSAPCVHMLDLTI